MGKNKPIIIKPYNEVERRRKVNLLLTDIMHRELDSLINKELLKLMEDFVTKGTTVEKDFPLIQHNRIMQVRLYNNKKQPSYIKLQRVETDEELFDEEEAEKNEPTIMHRKEEPMKTDSTAIKTDTADVLSTMPDVSTTENNKEISSVDVNKFNNKSTEAVKENLSYNF